MKIATTIYKMPDYSEYILKQHDTIKIYTNYRGDYTFLSDIFPGPEYAKKYIQQQSLQEFSKKDNALSAIVLNFDKKELLLEIYPGEQSDGTGIFQLEILLKLLSIQYPGWKILYAKNGTMDRLHFLDKEHSDEENDFMAYQNLGWDEPRGTFVSVDQSETLTNFWNESSLYEIVPKGLDFILNQKNQQPIEENKFPFGGIHLDLNLKSIFFWYFNPTPFFKKWAQQYWKGFNISYEWNGYKPHFERCNFDYFKPLIQKGHHLAIEQLRKEVVYTYEEYAEISSAVKQYKEGLKNLGTAERLNIFERALKIYKFNNPNS